MSFLFVLILMLNSFLLDWGYDASGDSFEHPSEVEGEPNKNTLADLSSKASSNFPDSYHSVYHVAGYQGMLSVGLGANYKRWSGEASLGFTPAWLAGENKYQFNLKNSVDVLTSFREKTIEESPLYVGVATLFSLFDEDAYWVLPEKYPRNYYPPNGILFAPYVGSEWEIASAGYYSPKSFGLKVYVEAVALDRFLEAYYRSEGDLRLDQIGSLAFGLKSSL